MPTEDQLAHAAAILNEGRKLVIMAGRGALGARPEVEALAERLGPRRQASSRQRRPAGRPPVYDRRHRAARNAAFPGGLEDCDTLLIVGSSFPYIEFYPQPGKAKCVQIELDPKRVSLRYPVEAALVGDTGRVIRALLPLLDFHQDRSFLETAQDGMREWRALTQERGSRTDTPMKPQVVAHELNKLLSDDAIIATDWARSPPGRHGTSTYAAK